MTDHPRISVVMAACDSESTVAAAVSSVLWQTHRDLELIVVDDGSTDATADIVAAFRDPRLTLVQQPNAGAGPARNVGITMADGDLVSFLDSDDLMFGQHLEALVAALTPGGRTIATANSYWLLPGGLDPSHVRHKGRFPKPQDQRLNLLQQNYMSPMSIFPRSMLDEIGGFDPSLRRSEDWDFWLRAVFAGYRVVHQPRPLSLYRWGEVSLSTNRSLVFAAERAIFERFRARADLTAEERSYLDRRLASPPPRLLSTQGDAALRDKRYNEAARLYASAAELSPSVTMLARKSRLLNVSPRTVGPLLRRRQLRREATLGFSTESEH